MHNYYHLIPQIDYLVNNAGRSQRAEAVATELAVDKELMDLNFVSTISLTKAVLPEMIECREGCVVVMSSVAGKIGKIAACKCKMSCISCSLCSSIGAPGSASYSASKHALQVSISCVDPRSSMVSVLFICTGLL